MKRKLFYSMNMTNLFLLIVLFFTECKKESELSMVYPETDTKIEIKTLKSDSLFQVVGYLKGDVDSWDTRIEGIDLSKLTCIIFSFVNPNSQGDFVFTQGQETKLISAITKARNNNLKVYLSFAGGSAPSYWDDLIKPANRAYTISNLRKLTTTYGIDGLDVDLENARVTTDYSGFVIQLSDTLQVYSKSLTAALTRYTSPTISDSALGRYDFVNIMSYDHTGPWNSNDVGPHSSYADFLVDYNYYIGRGIAPSKIIMGVPFYAYGFNGVSPTSLIYSDLIATYSGADTTNVYYPSSGGVYYYDGLPAITQKTNFAINNNIAGLMIWEVAYDTNDDNSLLKCIDDIVNGQLNSDDGNQYIKIEMNGNSSNQWNHLTEVTLYKNGIPLAFPSGHDAPAILVDGVGVDGSSTGYFGAGSGLSINLGETVDFDAVKLGVYNGDDRTYYNVGVSLSFDGITYEDAVISDVQSSHVFEF